MKGKTICVTRKIKSYKGKPEIIINDPAQIKIREGADGGWTSAKKNPPNYEFGGLRGGKE